MKRQAGHTFVANAIWAIGLPRLPSFATEQRGKQLSAKDLAAVPEAINSVLNWLVRLASALTRQELPTANQVSLLQSKRHEEPLAKQSLTYELRQP